MKNRKIRLTKLGKAGIIICVLFIFQHFISDYFNSENLEIRNGLLNNFLTFSIFYWLISASLILLTIWNIKRENKKGTTGLSSFILLIVCIVSIVISSLFTLLTPPKMTDAIVYKSENNSRDKIICQFFLTGIASGNPNWKIIQTKDQDKLIRKIQEIKDSTLIEEFHLESFPKNPPKIRSFNYNGRTYNLETYKISNYGYGWEKYKVKKSERLT